MPFAKFSPLQVRHIRESKTGLDSGFHTIDSRFQVLDSLFVELGFGILIVSGSPDSLSCISDSKAKGSGFYKQKFLGIGFRIPDSGFHKQKFFWIPECFTLSGISAPEWCFPEVLSVMFQQDGCYTLYLRLPRLAPSIWGLERTSCMSIVNKVCECVRWF